MEARGHGRPARLADMRILADKADVYEMPQPDGSVKRRAGGRGQRRLHPRRGAARGRPRRDGRHRPRLLRERGRLRRARRLHRGAPRRANRRRHLQGRGRLASPPARSRTRAGSSAPAGARIEVNDKIIAQHRGPADQGRARVLPALVLLPDQQRRPLRPASCSRTSATRRTVGYTAGTGFFWAMGRSARPDLLRRLLVEDGLRPRPRAALRRWPRPRAGASAPTCSHLKRLARRGGRAAGRARPSTTSTGTPLQMLPGKTRATLIVRKSSNLLFRSASRRTSPSRTSRSKRCLGRASSATSSFAVAERLRGREHHLPTAPTTRTSASGCRASRCAAIPRQIGAGGLVFGLQAGADAHPLRQPGPRRRLVALRLRAGAVAAVPAELPRRSPPRSATASRATARRSARETDRARTATRRAGQRSPGRRSTAPSSRPASRCAGPTFAPRLRHPRLGLQRPLQAHDRSRGHLAATARASRTRTRSRSSSGEDYLYGDQPGEVRAGPALLRQAARPDRQAGAAGRFFEWRLGQTYYVQIKRRPEATFDPNYSSSAFGPGSQPAAPLAALQSRMRLRPTPDYAIDYHARVRRQLPAAAAHDRWPPTSRPAPSPDARAGRARCASREDPGEAHRQQPHAARRHGGGACWPKRLALEGSLDYDLMLRHRSTRCAGSCATRSSAAASRVEYTRYNWNGTIDKTWRFNVELAGMSSHRRLPGRRRHRRRGARRLPVRLLVTGAGGFVGGHLVVLLRASSRRSRSSAPCCRTGGITWGSGQGMRVVETDLNDPAQARALVDTVRPDRVLHLAGQSSPRHSFLDPGGTLRTNVLGIVQPARRRARARAAARRARGRQRRGVRPGAARGAAAARDHAAATGLAVRGEQGRAGRAGAALRPGRRHARGADAHLPPHRPGPRRGFRRELLRPPGRRDRGRPAARP